MVIPMYRLWIGLDQLDKFHEILEIINKRLGFKKKRST